MPLRPADNDGHRCDCGSTRTLLPVHHDRRRTKEAVALRRRSVLMLPALLTVAGCSGNTILDGPVSGDGDALSATFVGGGEREPVHIVQCGQPFDLFRRWLRSAAEEAPP